MIDGLAALRAIWDSDGFALRVSDEEALAARDMLARNGIFVEPSGAVAYEGVVKKGYWVLLWLLLRGMG